MVEGLVRRVAALPFPRYESVGRSFFVETGQNNFHVFNGIVKTSVNGSGRYIINRGRFLSGHESSWLFEQGQSSLSDINRGTHFGVLVSFALVSLVDKTLIRFLMVCSSGSCCKLLFWAFTFSNNGLLLQLLLLFLQFIHFLNVHLIKDWRHFCF